MDSFLGEIRMFAGNFAPTGWALCNGQILPITQNTALFSLLGTQYGGNGTSTFALPNLQASLPLGAGNGAGLSPRVQGETGGEALVTLQAAQIPSHTHGLMADAGAGSSTDPSGHALANNSSGSAVYKSLTNPTAMAGASVSAAGSNFPHENQPPYLALSFIIALTGIFPSRS